MPALMTDNFIESDELYDDTMGCYDLQLFVCLIKVESRLLLPKYKIVYWNGKLDEIVIMLLKHSKT